MISQISQSFLPVPKAKVEYNNRNFTLGVIPRFGADDFKKSEKLSYETDKILQFLVKNESPTAIKIQQNLSVDDSNKLGKILKKMFDKGYIDAKFCPILQNSAINKPLPLSAFKNYKEMQKNFWSDPSDYYSAWMKDSTSYNITLNGGKYLSAINYNQTVDKFNKYTDMYGIKVLAYCLNNIKILEKILLNPTTCDRYPERGSRRSRDYTPLNKRGYSIKDLFGPNPDREMLELLVDKGLFSIYQPETPKRDKGVIRHNYIEDGSHYYNIAWKDRLVGKEWEGFKKKYWDAFFIDNYPSIVYIGSTKGNGWNTKDSLPDIIDDLREIHKNIKWKNLCENDNKLEHILLSDVPVSPDLNELHNKDVKKYLHLLGMKNSTYNKIETLSNVIQTVYKNNKDVKNFLLPYYSTDSVPVIQKYLEKQYLQEAEKNLPNQKQSLLQSLLQRSIKKPIEGEERDKFIIESMHESVTRAYESGNILTYYIPEDIQTDSNKKLSNEDLLKKERKRLENIINEVLTIYINKLFGVELATIRLKPEQDKFDNLKAQCTDTHTKFQEDQQNEEIKQDFIDHTTNLKSAKAYTDVADKRLANMNYLADKAKIILDECMKTWHIDNVRIVESLDKEYFTQIADRLRSLKEENDAISKKLEIFHDEEKKYLPEMQKSITAKKS